MLNREEYVEQAHFFATLGERMQRNEATQDLLAAIREEILITTKLPLAIDFLLTELKHTGVFAPAMRKLGHYFTPYQTYIIGEAEDERGQFDLRVALVVLQREAEYRAGEPTPQGMFLYQFEVLCRNRLGYDRGLSAIGADPIYPPPWQKWILALRRQVGMVDLADLIYVRSEYQDEIQAKRGAGPRSPDFPALFGSQEGRIALANRQKDPLLLFAALHRQLGYPEIPRPKPIDRTAELTAGLFRRVERLETRLKLLEEEQRGGIDLSQFIKKEPG